MTSSNYPCFKEIAVAKRRNTQAKIEQRLIDSDLPAAVHAFHAHERGEEIGTMEADEEATAAARDILSDPAQRKKWYPKRDVSNFIVRKLEKVTSMTGHRSNNIFEDWIRIVLATQMVMPLQLLYARTHNGAKIPFEEEPPETQQMWKESMRRYRKEDWPKVYEVFAECWAEMWMDSQDTHNDYLGRVYEELGASNKWFGQFFTPYAVGVLMTQINLGFGAEQLIGWVTERMAAALEAAGYGDTYRLMGMQIGLEYPATTRDLFERHMVECWPHYNPVRILEPCSGAGILMLTALQEVPQWITDTSLAFYFAVDKDPICAMMTAIQMTLYGANGYNMLCSIPIMLPEDQLPTQAQLWRSVQRVFSFVQCADSLSHEWVWNAELSRWTMIPWTETEEGKAWIAGKPERECEAIEHRKAQKAAEYEAQAGQRAAAKVKAVKQKAKADGQELLFDFEMPPIEEREALEADAKHTNGNGNGHTNGNGHAVPGAAGDWDTFVTKAKAVKGTPAAATGAAVAAAIVEELAEELTQGEMFS
jgi:hypothetical protein